LFIRANTIERAPQLIQLLTNEDTNPEDPIYKQNEDILKPWVDAHRLKKLKGTWYKEGRWVVNVDRCAQDLGDESVIVEIHRFRTLMQEGDCIEV